MSEKPARNANDATTFRRSRRRRAISDPLTSFAYLSLPTTQNLIDAVTPAASFTGASYLPSALTA